MVSPELNSGTRVHIRRSSSSLLFWFVTSYPTWCNARVHVGSTCPVDILRERGPLFRDGDLTLDESGSLRAESSFKMLAELL